MAEKRWKMANKMRKTEQQMIENKELFSVNDGAPLGFGERPIEIN